MIFIRHSCPKVFQTGQRREPSAGRNVGSSRFLDRTPSSNEVYPTNTNSSSSMFNTNVSNDSSKNVNTIVRHRVDSESSANIVKNAVLRRTDEIEDPMAHPKMSGSTVSLITQPSNREQTLNRFANQTNRHSGTDRSNDGIQYGTHVWKDESPTKSIPRCLLTF